MAEALIVAPLARMKAIVYETYGPPEVLELRDVPMPVPGEHEVLIRIRAATVSSADWRARSLEMPPGFGLFGRPAFGLRRPRRPILGTELAGDIVSVGRAVTGFVVGDPVFAFPGARLGCHAEFRCMRADDAMALKPAALTYAQAAALSFGGATMLDFFRRAALRAGEHVLVNGSSGTVGTAAVQLAKHFGAQVTAVCSTANVALVRSIGADQVIDYSQEDFVQSGTRYDLIVDTVGNAPFARCGPALATGGRLVVILGGLAELLKAPWVGWTSDKKVIAGPASERPEYLHTLRELAESGRFTPVIDRTYPLAEARAAHAYVAQGRKRGSVVLTMGAAGADAVA